MMRTTVTFDVVKASADYICPCSGCGKVLRRKVTVEHTVNPFNKNEDGSVRTRGEVYRAAQAEADRQARDLDGVAQVCRDCEDEPNRRQLLEMAKTPGAIFPRPDKFWGSPMHVLEERKHVEQVHEKCSCGSDCCSGWKRSPGFRITRAGMERAAKLTGMTGGAAHVPA